MKKHTYKKAFTIVELIIVIAVIGVLAAILIPAFTNIIAKANSKSALSDARNTLTAFLAENLEVVDGSIATSIVIFINKAKMYYVYGYSNSGPDMGKLMQSGGNPFDYDDLEQLINDYNLQNEADATIEEIAETKAFFLRTTPSCTVKGGTKDMEAINSTYINLTDRMGDGLPDTSQVFDGYLVGMVVEAGAAPGNGTNPGENPGGGGGSGGDPSTTSFTITYSPGAPEAEVSGMPEPLTYTVNAGGFHDVVASIPTRDGYNFGGWDYNGTEVNAGYPIQDVNTNITLAAKWEIAISYTLEFVEGDYTLNLAGFTNPTTYNEVTPIGEILTNASATKAGEIFAGWKDQNSDKTFYLPFLPSY